MAHRSIEEGWERAVAQWRDENSGETKFLGLSSAITDPHSCFLFRAGLSKKQKGEPLVSLRLPVKYKLPDATPQHSEESGPGKKELTEFVFLLVRADSFALDGKDAGLSLRSLHIADVRPPTLFSVSRELGEFGTVMRAHFNLNSPASALMPKMRGAQPASPTYRDVLLSIQSLSRATTFNIYFKRNDQLISDLESLYRKACGHSLPAFTLDLQSRYHGKGADVNAWENFDLGASDEQRSAVNKQAGATQDEISNPLTVAEALPATHEERGRGNNANVDKKISVYARSINDASVDTVPARKHHAGGSSDEEPSDEQSTVHASTNKRLAAKPVINSLMRAGSRKTKGSPGYEGQAIKRKNRSTSSDDMAQGQIRKPRKSVRFSRTIDMWPPAPHSNGDINASHNSHASTPGVANSTPSKPAQQHPRRQHLDRQDAGVTDPALEHTRQMLSQRLSRFLRWINTVSEDISDEADAQERVQRWKRELGRCAFRGDVQAFDDKHADCEAYILTYILGCRSGSEERERV